MDPKQAMLHHVCTSAYRQTPVGVQIDISNTSEFVQSRVRLQILKPVRAINDRPQVCLLSSPQVRLLSSAWSPATSDNRPQAGQDNPSNLKVLLGGVTGA